MNQPGDAPLPDWAQQARRVTRAALGVGSAVVVASWVLAGIDLVVDASLRGDWAVWAFRIGFGGAVAVVVVAGLVWLAGETVAGFRSRRSSRKD